MRGAAGRFTLAAMVAYPPTGMRSPWRRLPGFRGRRHEPTPRLRACARSRGGVAWPNADPAAYPCVW